LIRIPLKNFERLLQMMQQPFCFGAAAKGAVPASQKTLIAK
jgi:hypothetical protein